MRYLPLVALLLWVTPAQAQITLVGEDYTVCTLTSSCTFDAAVTAQAGDLLYAVIGNRENSAITTFSDATNGNWTCPAALDQTDAAAGTRVQGCYFIGSGAASLTPVADHAADARVEMNFQVWRPTGTVTLDSTQEGTNAAGTAHVTPELTTGATAALIVCGYFSNGTGAPTAGSGFTLLTDADARFMGQYDITSVGSVMTTCPITSGSSTTSAGVAVSFADAGGGAAAVIRGPLIGVLP